MTENELLQELIKELGLPALDPEHEVTADMLADQTGMSVRRMADKLAKMEKEGRLKSRWVKSLKGRRALAYHEIKV